MPELDNFDDLANLPLDDPPEEDGDDNALPPVGEASEIELFSALETAPMAGPKGIYVPLHRSLKKGDTGRDVMAVQRAMKKAGLRTRPPTGSYGVHLVREVKELQRRAGQQATGKYGKRAHAALCKRNGFDRYGAWLMGQTDSLRERVVNAAFFYYHHRDQIGYLQRRPMLSVLRHQVPNRFPSMADCSEFVTLCFLAGHADDPNGLSFSGYGNTATQSPRGRAVTNRTVRPADIAFYGNPIGHEALFLGNNKVMSLGGSSGPSFLNLDYREDRSKLRSYLP